MKKLLSLSLAVLLVLGTATGCAKKETAKELLQKTLDQATSVSSSSTEMNMSAKVEASEAALAQDASIQGIIDMVNAGKVNMTMASDAKNGNATGKVSVESNGISFAMDINMVAFKQLIMKTPLAEKLITLDLSQDTETPMDVERMKLVNKEVSAIFLTAIKDESLKAEYKVDFEGKDGKTKLNYVTLTMDNATLVAFLKETVPAIYNAPETRKLLEESITASLKAADQEATPEKIQESLDAMVTEFPTMLDEMQKQITFDNLVVKMGIDKEYNTRAMTMDLAVTAAQGETSLKVAMNVASEQFAFNKPVAAPVIEVTEENSIPFEEFLMQMMFGGLGGQ